MRVDILHRGLLLSLSVSRLLASPSRSWTVRVHPGSVTYWRPSSDSGSGVPPMARLPPNCPVQHSCSLPSDAPLLSHTNLGICILSLSLYVSSGSVSRLLRRSLTLLENGRGHLPKKLNMFLRLGSLGHNPVLWRNTSDWKVTDTFARFRVLQRLLPVPRSCTW